jgi:hypothetical protein
VPSGPARSVLGPVGTSGQPETGVDAQIAEWLGLPPRGAVPDPGQGRQLGVLPRIRSRRVRPARLVVETPSPTYPPAQARPVPVSRPTDVNQSRAMPSGPPHRWVIWRHRPGREQVDQGVAHGLVHAAVAVELGPDGRAEVVGRAPAAEGHPAVLGALTVDDQVAVVGERLPSARPVSAQNESGRGSVAIMSEYTGTRVRSSPCQRAGVALGGPHHGAGPHRAPDRSHPAGTGWPAPRSARRWRPRGAPPPRPGRAPAGPGRRPHSGGYRSHPGRRWPTMALCLGGGEEGGGRPRRCPGPPGLGHLRRVRWQLGRGAGEHHGPTRWNPHSMPSVATTRPTSRTVSSMASRMASPGAGSGHLVEASPRTR